MKKIKIIQNAATFISDLTVDEINLLQKQSPDSLAIAEPTSDGYVEEIFRVNHKNTAYGEICEDYITFVDKTAEGNACLTVLIPANNTDREAYMFDKYAHAVNMLKIVERKAKAALKNLIVTKEAFSKEFINLDEEITLNEALEEVDIIVKAEKATDSVKEVTEKIKKGAK